MLLSLILFASYALERHLHKDEVIHPPHEVGRFRGGPVFARANVQRLRAAETWLHEGRVIKVGQQPLKRVAQRAHTINRKRALELAKADVSAEVPTQGLYAEWQTELYIPDAVINVSSKYFYATFCLTARIDRERFPKTISATSIFSCRVCCRAGPYISHVCLNEPRRLRILTFVSVQGIAKIARQLEIDFAPAVVRSF
jgi:hypothetical protein